MDFPTAATQPLVGRSHGARLGAPLAPAMPGAVLTVQTRVKCTTKWISSGVTVTVGANGTYSTPFTFASAVKEYIRFSYTGSQTGPWLSAKSPGRLFVVT